MRIILDECVPVLVQRKLPTYEIVTVQQMGWSGIKNGALLRLVAADFDIFITSDKNLRYQQNLGSFDIAVIILPSNQVPAVLQLIPDLDETLRSIVGRELVEL